MSYAPLRRAHPLVLPIHRTGLNPSTPPPDLRSHPRRAPEPVLFVAVTPFVTPSFFMTTPIEKSFLVGKFLVSPYARITDAGDFTASISIRSGRGIGTHDRIFRFAPRFQTSEGALRYAAVEGRSLLPPQVAN